VLPGSRGVAAPNPVGSTEKQKPLENRYPNRHWQNQERPSEEGVTDSNKS
jgi:hypothetical protein